MNCSGSCSPEQPSPGTGKVTPPHKAAAANQSNITALTNAFSKNTAVYSVIIIQYLETVHR